MNDKAELEDIQTTMGLLAAQIPQVAMPADALQEQNR
jgi:hypothetical protein